MKLLTHKMKKHKFDDMEEEEEWQYLKCLCCSCECNTRGEFFSHYKNMRKVIMAIYMMVSSFTLKQIQGELRMSCKLATHLLNALSLILSQWLTTKIRCDVGKWKHVIMDEAVTGKRKYNQGKHVRQELAWYMTIVNFDDKTRKVAP